MTNRERMEIKEIIEEISYLKTKLQSLINEKEDNKEEDFSIVITKYIRRIGVPAHLKGYNYIREAIQIVMEDPTSIEFITKKIYPKLAKKFKTSDGKVERAIRTAIEIAWERGNVEIINEIFGYTIDIERGRPTNTEFIALIADEIRLRYK